MKAQTKQEYRSAHQPSLSDSITADKIDIPKLKEEIRVRNGYLNNYDLSDLKKLEKLQNNPEADITIYRASPKNELNDGDWVTTDKIYANDIKRQNGGKVYSYNVKVKDLRFPKDSETLPYVSMASTFTYSPKTSQLTDIWNKANKEIKLKAKPEIKLIPKELEPLVEEARKYKSAEEFIKNLIYHGSFTGEFKPTYAKFGISFSKDSNVAKTRFAQKFGRKEFQPGIKTFAVKLKKDTKIFSAEKAKELSEKGWRESKISLYARKQGFDGVDFSKVFPFEQEIRIWNLEKVKNLGDVHDLLPTFQQEIFTTKTGQKSIRNRKIEEPKQSLTDFYNQAVKGTKEVKEVKKPTLPKRQPPKNIPPKKPAVVKSKTANQELIGKSKLAQGVEAKAIAKKLTEGFADLPEYEKINIKDQATKARKLLEDDYPRAERIALGKELPPEGILPESVFIAVENRAIKNKDVNTLRRLATESGLSNEATLMGQRIRTLAERVEDSPTAAMAKVIKNRKEYYALKHKTPLDEAIKRETKKIKSYVKPVKEDEWIKFINELTC